MTKVVIKDKADLCTYRDILQGSLKEAEDQLRIIEEDPAQSYTEDIKSAIDRCSKITASEFEGLVWEFGQTHDLLENRSRLIFPWVKGELQWKGSGAGFRDIAVAEVMRDLTCGCISDFECNRPSYYYVLLLQDLQREVQSQIRKSAVTAIYELKGLLREVETLLNSKVEFVIMDEVKYRHILNTVGEK